MSSDNNVNFKWDELLKRIKRKNVIPVIGHGLYRVEIESEGKSNCLLYDYLAEQVLKKSGTAFQPAPDENHKFAKACLEFLENNNYSYLKLSDFLKETIKKTRLIPVSSLWKLARIKNFNMFINTVYDDFLAKSIRTVRSFPTKVFHYTASEKDLNLLDQNLFTSLKYSQSTLVYNIFGNMKGTMAPAYTERDILETIVEFQKDMVVNNQHNLLLKLKNSSLLFIGCGYNDWLFRFFIRTTANKPYKFNPQDQTCNFVGDDFSSSKKHPFEELPKFLKNCEIELFHSADGTDFVDLLFERIEKEPPDESGKIEVIQPLDFPGNVFISFEGTDRSTARLLAENLREDGINVWLDESKFKGGNDVDKTIYKAIDRCPVFIPLISQNSEQLTDMGKPKYHLKEWLRAHSNKESGNKNVEIMPVKIDDTKWMYEDFKPLFYYNIPNDGRVGDYEKLLNQLKVFQEENQDE